MEDIREGFKTCSRCKAEKPFSDFYPDSRRKIGFSSWCRNCTQADNKNWKRNHPVSVKLSKRQWRRNFDPSKRNENYYRYGVTREWYESKLKEQDEGCGMCGTKDSGTGHRFHIDHNHKTGKVRGVLCYRCNIFLAHFEHDIRRPELALAYLKKYPH